MGNCVLQSQGKSLSQIVPERHIHDYRVVLEDSPQGKGAEFEQTGRSIVVGVAECGEG